MRDLKGPAEQYQKLWDSAEKLKQILDARLGAFPAPPSEDGLHDHRSDAVRVSC